MKMGAKVGHFAKEGNNSPKCLFSVDGLHCSPNCLPPVAEAVQTVCVGCYGNMSALSMALVGCWSLSHTSHRTAEIVILTARCFDQTHWSDASLASHPVLLMCLAGWFFPCDNCFMCCRCRAVCMDSTCWVTLSPSSWQLTFPDIQKCPMR